MRSHDFATDVARRDARFVVVSYTFVGSLEALDSSSTATHIPASTRVCVLATAAAFQGSLDAIDRVRERIATSGAGIVGLEVIDRRSANDPSIVAALASADVVVLTDGAALHARSVWRDSALAMALATSRVIAIGSVGSVLGDTMIDPRGGAPTTGLGFFSGVVVSVSAGSATSNRTRDLLGDQVIFVEMGPHSMVTFDGQWRVDSGEDLVVTRGSETVLL
ncbi:MAG TPA: hypothetical protein VIJ86_12240 [Acidimicrobiales bacterium]